MFVEIIVFLIVIGLVSVCCFCPMIFCFAEGDRDTYDDYLERHHDRLDRRVREATREEAEELMRADERRSGVKWMSKANNEVEEE
jgi:hypothetical protein